MEDLTIKYNQAETVLDYLESQVWELPAADAPNRIA